MCEDPRVPGNYEPGDDVEGYAEFQPDAILWEDTDECRLCEDPHVLGNYEPGDDVEGYAIFNQMPYFGKIRMNADCARIRTSQEPMNLVTTWRDMQNFNQMPYFGKIQVKSNECHECRVCNRHGWKYWSRYTYGQWHAAGDHFAYTAGFQVLQLVNFVIAQWQSTPVCIHRSWPMCQYSYWADRDCARKLAEPTLACWLIWTRSFRNAHARSTIWVITRFHHNSFPRLGAGVLDKPNISRRLPFEFASHFDAFLSMDHLVMKHSKHLGFVWLCSIGV